MNKKKGGFMSFGKRSFLLLSIILLVLSFIGCKGEKEEGTVIARAGDSELTVEELMQQVPPQLLMQTDAQTRRNVLENWITNEVIYQEALKKGYEEDPSVKERIEQMKKQIVTQAYAQEALQGAGYVSDSEAMEYFEEHREDYNQRVEVSHISVNNPQQAQMILDRLEEGESFSELARNYSTDTSTAPNGGYFGSFRRGDFPRLTMFEKAAFQLDEPGEISDVVQTEFGYDILKLHSRKDAPGEVKYEDVASSIKQLLKQEKTRSRSQTLIDSLKNAYDTEIKPEVLDRELGSGGSGSGMPMQINPQMQEDSLR